MRFTKIQRHIYHIATQGTTSEWFIINKDNQYEFRKGVFVGKTAEEVFNIYKDYETENNFWDYLQFLYDEYDFKTKKAVYDIYHSIKKKVKE